MVDRRMSVSDGSSEAVLMMPSTKPIRQAQAKTIEILSYWGRINSKAVLAKHSLIASRNSCDILAANSVEFSKEPIWR